ncbi:MAG: hypothetical protein HY763_02440 [Planctomycetes bacterium]|nr:hypothetical protein [Planctomycetota bacterium]
MIVTFSQYDRVLKKLRCSGPSVDCGSEAYAAPYRKIDLGMTRSEVDSILGSPQGCFALLQPPVAPGPGIPHAIVYYGPLAQNQDPRRPLVLGPIRVLAGCEIDRLAALEYYGDRGVSIQQWSVDDGIPDLVPIELGWLERYKLIRKGMPRKEAEGIVGKPTALGRSSVGYGLLGDIDVHTGRLPRHQVVISYDEDSMTVVGKEYGGDFYGPGDPESRWAFPRE